MTFSDIIQAAAVIAAVGAAIIALVISAKDRKNTRDIAADDRREALRQAHLMFELDALVKLSENMNRGGSADVDESARMGIEALTLTGPLAPDRLPKLWAEKIGDDNKLRAAMADPEMPRYKRDALEVQLAVSAVLAEVRDSTTRR
ncbi:hypothetical protein [Herbiconiux sp. A18JL235]|uniref:Uncharacterized protein n=1 Tax=Herbiconiux sp. A18JL235 TaxID=3152363 RepID=A0AB39BL07_9MICO